MPDPAATTPRRTKSSCLTVLVSLGVLAVVLWIVGWIVFALAIVSGSEFSPDTFELRRFWFLRIPGTQWQVSPTARETPESLVPAASRHFLPASPNATPRWETVQNGYPTAPHHAYNDCYLLVDRLADVRFAWLNSELVTWLSLHADLEPLFWADVAELARDGHYLATTEFIEAAQRSQTADEYQRNTRAALTATFTRLGDYRRNGGDHAKAIEYYTAALDRDEHHRPAREGRAAAYADSGQDAQAAADRKRLDE